jgi:hypothetical protein
MNEICYSTLISSVSCKIGLLWVYRFRFDEAYILEIAPLCPLWARPLRETPRDSRDGFI